MGAKSVARTWSPQHQKAVSDARYGQCFNTLCERFYKHCDLCLNLLQLAAGSTVVVGAFNGLPKWVSTASAAAVGLLALLSVLWQPAVLAERHRVASGRFFDLLGKAWSTSTSTSGFLSELAAAQRDAPLGLRSLEMPAYLLACKAIGAPSTERLTFIESLCDAVA
jgi:hypothetical protein